MANEGSTKPTYSELEAENLRVRGLLQHIHLADKLKEINDGLMRMEEAAKKSPESKSLRSNVLSFRKLRDNLQAEMDELSGAESADIGKLDSVDENSEATVSPEAPDARVNKWEQPATADKSVKYSSQNQTKTMCTQDAYDQAGKVITTAIRGSAETGGEKAAPQNSETTVSPTAEVQQGNRSAGLSTDKSVEYSSQNQIVAAIKPLCPECHCPYRNEVHCDDFGHFGELDWACEFLDEKTSDDVLKLIDRPLDGHPNHVVTIGTRYVNLGSLLSEYLAWRWTCPESMRKLNPNFPRTSQNQTLSSGVEGAHEGTTADKKGDSREPEKLNNAHPEEFCDCCGARLVPDSGQGEGICPRCDVPQNLPSRLAESSLSSPPHEKGEL